MLPRAVESILAQGWQPLELIIVDDGSSDDTPAAIERMSGIIDEAGARLICIRQDNGGDAAARNAGLRAATAEWIAFADDDDSWAPGRLVEQIEALTRTGAAACCGLLSMGGATKPASAEKLLEGSCASAFLRGKQSAAITSLLVHRDAVAAAGEFDTSLRIGSDMEWIARLVHGAEFCKVERVVADYNQTPSALSRYEGLDQLIARDQYDLRTVDLIRERCHARAGFDPAAWSAFAARIYDRCVKHLLYAGEMARAEQLIQAGLARGADPHRLRATTRKLRKAKLLALVGRRLRHPKFARASDVRG
ncbi:MAG: glycosyltransferase family 2 protein [Planctomycetes bacterium]|nr:glycosyltransferase family 2 protein [Planctomycetota bacterium]